MPTGIRHTQDCPIGKGTADPWQSDLIRTELRGRDPIAGTRPPTTIAVRYECPSCHKAAVRSEPYDPRSRERHDRPANG